MKAAAAFSQRGVRKGGRRGGGEAVGGHGTGGEPQLTGRPSGSRTKAAGPAPVGQSELSDSVRHPIARLNKRG